MTEQEWAECTDWQAMKNLLARWPGFRRRMLLWAAGCRCGWAGLDADERAAVEALEQAEGSPAYEDIMTAGFALKRADGAYLCQLARDIYGPRAFRPPTRPPRELRKKGGLVHRFALAGYNDRLLPSGHLDPQLLSVLADALEEAGAAGELVEHLREPGPHVRGCHVIDLLLNKEAR